MSKSGVNAAYTTPDSTLNAKVEQGKENKFDFEVGGPGGRGAGGAAGHGGR